MKPEEMTQEAAIALLKEGKEAWEKWLEEHELSPADESELEERRSQLTFLEGADLSNLVLNGFDFCAFNLIGAKFSGAKLYRANLNYANLNYANLSETKLIEANLWGGKLSEAKLSRADLSRAELIKADLSEANLHKVNLYKVNFYKANLYKANLTNAELWLANLNYANFSNANLSNADLTDALLHHTFLTQANLSGANLTRADLIDTTVKEAIFDGCRVYGTSTWDLKGEPASQNALIITSEEQPVITVADLEVAQFIYLMINNQKIRDVIDTITSKAVLILGRFYEERKVVLDAIRDKLQTMDYVPIIFDFEPSANRNLTETVRLLANMSKFVIADITDPSSVPQELTAIIPDLKSLPVKPILWKEKDPYSDPEKEVFKRPYAMFQDWVREEHVLKVFLYNDKDHMITSLQTEVVDKVEAWFEETPSERIARENKLLGKVEGMRLAELSWEIIAEKLQLSPSEIEDLKKTID